MLQRKKGAHFVSIANGGAASDKTGVEVSQRSTGKDPHWDFLDDIEAPMWVDLTQECQFTYQDRDDEWFNVSHPLHHCSSQQLISAFTSARECTRLDLSVQEQCSPKLPCSVSRSRGKDYKSRKWGQANEKVTFDLLHSVKNLKNKPLSAISITGKVSSDRTSNGKPLGFGNSLSGSDSNEKSSLTEIDGRHDQSVIPLGDQNLLLNSIFFKGVESNLTSNVTSEGSEEQRQNSSELSSQLPDQTSRFLLALKTSLRKSCVTRQASRVQVTERRQSEGPNSSSSKSSVGSSLTHRCDGKNLTVRGNKDMTPGSRYVPGVTLASSDKVNVAKNPSTANKKLRTRSSALPSFKHQNTQGKVQQQTGHVKVLVPHSVNKRCSASATMKGKEKAIATTGRQISAGAKENLSREILSNTRMKVSRDVVQVQKVVGRKLPENNAKTKLVSQKEKLSRRGEGKSGTMAQKAHYFR